jgi:FlaA1/EpsC-like NDP-sugar epimerase
MKRVALLSLDLLLIACATILALLLRDNFVFSELHFQAILPYLTVTLISGGVVFSTAGVSWSVWRFSALNDYLKLVGTSVITVLIALGISFSMTRLEGVSRTVPVLQAMNMVFLLVTARLLIRLRHHHRNDPPQLVTKPAAPDRTSVLVFGTTRITELYLRSVAEFAGDKIGVAGLISRTQAKVGRRFLGVQVLGTSDDLT